MPRREFTKAVKLLAWNRCNGYCEGCTGKLYPTKYEFHHTKEDTFGGEPILENCTVLCTACHANITGKQAKVIAKSNRVRNKFLGIKTRKSRPIPGSRASGLRKKLDGTVEKR